MLVQKLTVDERDYSGSLVIQASAGNAAELIGLAEELNLRESIRTEGTIHILPEQPEIIE